MKNVIEKLEEKYEKIRRYRPIDDTFFEKIAEDKGVCEEILRVIFQDETLVVDQVIPQKSVKNMQGRSVVVDALCVLSNGKYCGIEVQRSSAEHTLKRVRYDASCITANITDPGVKFNKVPEVDMVYISEFDKFKHKKTLYQIEQRLTEPEEKVDNGLHEVYVNTVVDDGSEIAELMKCFMQEIVENEKFPRLSARVQFLKNTEEGLREMCAISDEIREEGRAVGREEGRAEMLKETIAKMLKIASPEQIIDLGYDREYIMGIANSL